MKQVGVKLLYRSLRYCHSVIPQFEVVTALYRCLRYCHSVIPLFEVLSQRYTAVWGTVTALYRSLRYCHSVIPQFEVLSQCYTVVWGTVTALHSSLRYCHSVCLEGLKKSHEKPVKLTDLGSRIWRPDILRKMRNKKFRKYTTLNGDEAPTRRYKYTGPRRQSIVWD
jgi:hypothetical protein